VVSASKEEVDTAISKKSKKKPSIAEDRLLSVFSFVDPIAKSTAEKNDGSGCITIGKQGQPFGFYDAQPLLVAEQPTVCSWLAPFEIPAEWLWWLFFG